RVARPLPLHTVTSAADQAVTDQVTLNTQRETATVIQGGTLSRLYSAGPLVRQEQQPQHDGERRAHAEIHVLDPGAARVKPGKRDPDGEQHQEGAGAAREPGRRAE